MRANLVTRSTAAALIALGLTLAACGATSTKPMIEYAGQLSPGQHHAWELRPGRYSIELVADQGATISFMQPGGTQPCPMVPMTRHWLGECKVDARTTMQVTNEDEGSAASTVRVTVKYLGM